MISSLNYVGETNELSPEWSTVVGIPVGIPAAGLYLTILAAIAGSTFGKAESTKKFSNLVLSVCAFAAAMAAVWFIGLQVFVVEHLCTYCLAAHTCGLLMAGLVLWNFPISLAGTIPAAGTALAGVAALAAIQWNADEPTTFEMQTFAPVASTPDDSEPEGELFSAPGFGNEGDNVLAAPIAPASETKPGNNDQELLDQTQNVSDSQFGSSFGLALTQLFNPTSLIYLPSQDDQQEPTEAEATTRHISINGGQTKLNVAQWPVCGEPDSEYIFVEMFDYTCPHCRENHQTIKQVANQFLNDKVAILALSVPMNRGCNSSVTHTDAKHAEACELARLSIAVWRVDPAKFGKFHDWMFTGTAAPSYATALAKAESTVGKQKLAVELTSGVADKYVATQVKLYNQLGAGPIPKMMFPTTTVSGKVGSAESLLQIIQQHGR